MVSFSRCAFVAALASLVGLVNGATVTSTTYYSSTAALTSCAVPAGGFTPTPQTDDTNKCIQSSSNRWEQRFCDSKYAYRASYTDSSCSTASMSHVDTQAIGVCMFASDSYNSGSGTSTYYYARKTTCNNDAGSAFPTSFPPSGWGMTNAYTNTTNYYKDATVCSDQAGVVNEPSAIKPGCNNGGDTPSYGSSQLVGNGGYKAYVTYSDSACQKVTEVDVYPVNCSRGESIATTGDFAGLPSLPSLAAVGYGVDDCSGEAQEFVFYPGCVRGRTYACAANQTTVIKSYWADGNCTTSITSTASYDASNGLPATGVKPTTGQCYSGVRFVCGIDTGRFSSASAVSVSMVAMIVAAIVAVFGRQL